MPCSFNEWSLFTSLEHRSDISHTVALTIALFASKLARFFAQYIIKCIIKRYHDVEQITERHIIAIVKETEMLRLLVTGMPMYGRYKWLEQKSINTDILIRNFVENKAITYNHNIDDTGNVIECKCLGHDILYIICSYLPYDALKKGSFLLLNCSERQKMLDLTKRHQIYYDLWQRDIHLLVNCLIFKWQCKQEFGISIDFDECPSAIVMLNMVLVIISSSAITRLNELSRTKNICLYLIDKNSINRLLKHIGIKRLHRQQMVKQILCNEFQLQSKLTIQCMFAGSDPMIVAKYKKWRQESIKKCIDKRCGHMLR